MPQVSIIIPTHGRPHLLPRAIESSLRSGSNVEVVVVDDASNDDTVQVCRTLEGIKYIRLDLNQGVAGARNVGVLNSKGDYITFLDDDDARINRSLDFLWAEGKRVREERSSYPGQIQPDRSK